MTSIQVSSQSILHSGWKYADDEGEDSNISTRELVGKDNCVAQQQPRSQPRSIQGSFSSPGSSCLRTNIRCQIEMNIKFECDRSLALVGEEKNHGSQIPPHTERALSRSDSSTKAFMEPIVERSMISPLFLSGTMRFVVL